MTRDWRARDEKRRKQDEQWEADRRAERVRRREQPTLEERIQDIKAVLSEHFGADTWQKMLDVVREGV